MGAWGIGNFENDTASDLLYEFEENPSKEFLEETLDAVYEDEYLDSDIALEALSAIEAITLIMGNSKEDVEKLENIDFETINNSFDKALFDKAIKSINRILDKSDNELYELWEESESFEDWKNVVLDLKKRVIEVMNQISTINQPISKEKTTKKKNKATGKKQILEEGQLYAVPLPDGSYTIAQLVNHHKISARASEDTFAFYNYKFSSLEEAKEKTSELDFSNPFSIATINGYLRQYGWTLLGKKDISITFNYKDNIDNIGLYEMRSTDPLIFLEPYFGLFPWDGYYKDDYLDKYILSNADMGKRIKYCKDYSIEELIEVLGENHIKVKERLKEEEGK